LFPPIVGDCLIGEDALRIAATIGSWWFCGDVDVSGVGMLTLSGETDVTEAEDIWAYIHVRLFVVLGS